MTKRDVSSFLPNLLGPTDFQLEGTPRSIPRRSTWNIVGVDLVITVEDDPDNDRTNLVFTAAGGGSSPAGAAGEIQVKNGSNFAGSVPSGTKPTTGILRLPYPGASPVPIVVTLDHLGTDRSVLQLGAGDSMIFGDAQMDHHCVGYSYQAEFEGAVSSVTHVGYRFYAAGALLYQLTLNTDGTIDIGTKDTFNRGTTEGLAHTREDTVKATAAPATLSTFATTTDAAHVIDAEVVAIKAGGTVMGRWKLSQGFLNSAGTVTGDTPDAPAPKFTGGVPSWTIAFNVSGTNVTLDVNPDVDTVTFYVVRSSMRTVAAA